MLFVVLHESILQTDLVSGKAYIQLYFPVVALSGLSAKADVGYTYSRVEFRSGICVHAAIKKKSSSQMIGKLGLNRRSRNIKTDATDRCPQYVFKY